MGFIPRRMINDASLSLFLLSMLHRIIQQKPSFLHNWIIFKVDSSNRATRSSDNMIMVLQCRTEVYKGSFKITATGLWNILPLDIRNAKSQHVFKNKRYRHLLLSWLRQNFEVLNCDPGHTVFLYIVILLIAEYL